MIFTAVKLPYPFARDPHESREVPRGCLQNSAHHVPLKTPSQLGGRVAGVGSTARESEQYFRRGVLKSTSTGGLAARPGESSVSHFFRAPMSVLIRSVASACEKTWSTSCGCT